MYGVDETPLSEELSRHRQGIAVATVRGRPYYNITHTLRSMNLSFQSLSPQEAASSGARVVITTRDEAELVNLRGAVMLDTELQKFPAVAKAKILRSIYSAAVDDQLVVGVDPGSRIGISVLYLNEEIHSFVESSPVDAIEEICRLLGGIESRRKTVRIGDGNIRMARQMGFMIKGRFGREVVVEIVDEHGTSKPSNTDANRRGLRDRSSARNIAFRSGKAL